MQKELTLQEFKKLYHQNELFDGSSLKKPKIKVSFYCKRELQDNIKTFAKINKISFSEACKKLLEEGLRR